MRKTFNIQKIKLTEEEGKDSDGGRLREKNKEALLRWLYKDRKKEWSSSMCVCIEDWRRIFNIPEVANLATRRCSRIPSMPHYNQ